MNFTLPVHSPHEHAQKWITLWSGVLGLTLREQEVLVEFLAIYLTYKPKILDSKLLWENTFSTSSRTQVKEALGLTRFALGNYLTDFRKHKLLVNLHGYDQLSPNLLPDTTFTVTFSQP